MPENKPIYTSNPNDPRLKAYNDSLQAYKNFLEDVAYKKSQGEVFMGMSPTGGMKYANPQNPHLITLIEPKKKPVNPIIYQPSTNTYTTKTQTHHPVVHHYQEKHYPDKTPQEIHDHIFNNLYPDIPKEVVQAAMDKKMHEINQTLPSAPIPQPPPRLYQGYRFMQATGLKPDYYTDEQILEAMQKRNKPIDAELLKKQGQSYFNY